MAKSKNRYEFYDDYIVGYTTNTDRPFIFDKEDAELVMQYIWHEDKTTGGYSSVRATVNGRKRRITQVLGYAYCDHIDRDTFNNRRCNLREADKSSNAQNHDRCKHNTSGVTGVSFNNQLQKWDAYIWNNNKKQRIGYYEKIEEAIVARLTKEKEMYGEFAPQRNLFEKYGVA